MMKSHFAKILLLPGALVLVAVAVLLFLPALATAQPGAEAAAQRGAPVATCVPGSSDYTVVVGSGGFEPGTEMIPGSHCNQCVTTIDLPFAFVLYDRKFKTAIVGSNGVLGFVSNSNGYQPTCLPSGGFDYAILPGWEQLVYRYGPESPTGQGDENSPQFETGVFTSITGSAPNRIFNIEWRAKDHFNVSPVDMEIRLYEDSPGQQFDLVYASVNHHGGHAVVGVQKGVGSQFTQYSCLTQGRINPGVKLTFTLPRCTVEPPPISNAPLLDARCS